MSEDGADEIARARRERAREALASEVRDGLEEGEEAQHLGAVVAHVLLVRRPDGSREGRTGVDVVPVLPDGLDRPGGALAGELMRQALVHLAVRGLMDWLKDRKERDLSLFLGDGLPEALDAGDRRAGGRPEADVSDPVATTGDLGSKAPLTDGPSGEPEDDGEGGD